KKIDDIIPDSARSSLQDKAGIQVSSAKSNIDLIATDYENKQKEINYHEIEWHRKFTLAVACMILFLIGAPLGSIIRKGGLGTPMIFAIVFFMLFYFASTTGEKSASANTLTPFTGMWLATFMLLPIGIFLTYNATHASHTFNKEFYSRLTRIF